jgi:serine/threonine protein phosphatase PrpC
VVETTGTTRLYAAAAENIPASSCHALIELAKSRGGFDNNTVHVLKFEGLDAMKGDGMNVLG